MYAPYAAGGVNVPMSIVMQASAVAINGRALIIEGDPGSGKSSLALALIDRGALLIGDDGVTLQRSSDRVFASVPPNIGGKIELRGVGIFECDTAPPTPLSLILSLEEQGERLPEEIQMRDILGVSIPVLPFIPGSIAPANRAEWALRRHGIAQS